MTIKFTPVTGSAPTDSNLSPSSLAKEAKKLNNAEKGKAADEKYLSDEQDLDRKMREIKEANRLVALRKVFGYFEEF